MSQTLTRQTRPKTLDPHKKLQVIYSINQLEKALEDNNDKLEPDEVKNLIDEEKRKLQEIINKLKGRDKTSNAGGNQKQSNDTTSSSSNSSGSNGNNLNQSSTNNFSNANYPSGIATSSILIPPVEISPLNVPRLMTFQRPEHYIRFPVHKDFVSGIKLEDNTIVHYNMVKADEEFLQELRIHIKSGISEIDFIKMIDLMEKSTGRGSEISFDEAIQIVREKNINVKNQVALIIYKYWKLRRHKLGKPLLRHFWPITSPHDSSPYACFRPRVREKMTLRRPRRNNKETCEKLEKFLDDFRKVEKSFRKLKQRDEKKLLLAELDACIFDQMRHEVFDPFYRCPYWDRLKNYKLQKKQQKKEMRSLSQLVVGGGLSNFAQIGGSLFLVNDISANINSNELNLLLKQLSTDICNLELLLNYSWDSETSVLSYYYFGSLMLSSSIFHSVRNNPIALPITDNFNAQSINENKENENHKSNIEVGKLELSPAFNRIALPNYILSIYKNGVDLSRLESLQSFRTPCRPHRLIRRRGRGGRIWFDRHSLVGENYEPLFTDPDLLDYSSNCGNNNQFMLDSYFKKSIAMCDIIDKLCTEGNFDSYGNDTHGSSNTSSNSMNEVQKSRTSTSISPVNNTNALINSNINLNSTTSNNMLEQGLQYNVEVNPTLRSKSRNNHDNTDIDTY